LLLAKLSSARKHSFFDWEKGKKLFSNIYTSFLPFNGMSWTSQQLGWPVICVSSYGGIVHRHHHAPLNQQHQCTHMKFEPLFVDMKLVGVKYLLLGY
jgi:hypothetical protein